MIVNGIEDWWVPRTWANFNPPLTNFHLLFAALTHLQIWNAATFSIYLLITKLNSHHTSGLHGFVIKCQTASNTTWHCAEIFSLYTLFTIES